jgi:hypothetical protein
MEFEDDFLVQFTLIESDSYATGSTSSVLIGTEKLAAQVQVTRNETIELSGRRILTLQFFLQCKPEAGEYLCYFLEHRHYGIGSNDTIAKYFLRKHLGAVLERAASRIDRDQSSLTLWAV